jgi:hypothetical protein
MGYRVHKEAKDFKVVEVNNGEVKTIMSNLSEKKARKMSFNLNYGGGFDGFTPDFFLNRLAESV